MLNLIKKVRSCREIRQNDELKVQQKNINSANLNKWLEQNTRNMREATILAPACWYDGCDGTCSA